MAVPAMDGTMAASYLTMRGQKWMIGQHDNRLYHRPRWERTERSETTSASRIEYPNRCDWRCSHDRERCIRRVRKQFRWTLSRGNICSADAVQRLPAGT